MRLFGNAADKHTLTHTGKNMPLFLSGSKLSPVHPNASPPLQHLCALDMSKNNDK